MAVVIVGPLGMLLERVLYRRFYAAPILDQVLLSIAFIFMSIAIGAISLRAAGAADRAPVWLSGRVDIGVGVFPTYRVFLIVMGVDAGVRDLAGHRAVTLWRVCPRGRRQPPDGRVGRHQRNPFFIVCFGLGTGLAALGGSLGADLLPIYPGYPNDYLVYFLIVVAVAGIGNVGGAFAVALAFGIVDTAHPLFPARCRAHPDLRSLVMAVLFRKPHGFAPKIHA